jgi:pSer/pThr/pTyr-binding forkhead associated (FHA) protein
VLASAAASSPPAAAPQPEAEKTLPWEMAAGQAAAAPQTDVAETVIPDVAATMITSEASGEARESTTLMPAWQPPPAAPAPADVAETVAIDNKAQPAFGTAPGAGRQAELTIESGPDAGHSHRAGDNALRLGRSPDNDVILRDPATSGHHARLERRGDQFWLVDLGSTNGTLVNGEPIQERELTHGDRVTIGQNAVQFSVIGS